MTTSGGSAAVASRRAGVFRWASGLSVVTAGVTAVASAAINLLWSVCTGGPSDLVLDSIGANY